MRYLLFCLFFSLSFLSAVHAASSEEVLLCLAKRARESQSDAILIVHNGRAIFEYRSDPYWQPIDTLAITKSVVAVAIGVLIDEGKIASIDTPVYEFYPEWNQGNKKLITIRHLLNHTSGLQAEPNSDEIHQTQDSIQLALCAELTSIPGTYYFYNNKAVNLLSGIVEKASGECLSEYAKQKLFIPLGIENVSWQCDAAHHDYAMAHMSLTAPDLAKIGELVAKGGVWHGQRIVSQKWINQMTTQGQWVNPFSAYLCWLDYHSVQCYWDEPLLKQYENAGISTDYSKRLRALQGQVIVVESRVKSPLSDLCFSNNVMDCLGGQKMAADFCTQVTAKQLPQTRWMVSGVKSIAAHGYLGQQLLVYPSKDVIAVRQARSRSPEGGAPDTFPDFANLVEQLIHCQGY